MIKKITPERISLLTTIILLLIFASFLFYFKINILAFLVSLFIFGSLSYILILFTLEYFIYSKIKLIYKTIHNYKTNKTQPLKFIDNYNIDPLKKVNEDVKEWAINQKTEINKLLATDQYRKEFLGNVSHELKTPIFSIQGYIETLIDGAIDDDEVKYTFLKKAADSAERLNLLVNDLLDISKIESNSLNMKFDKFDIHELSLDIIENYQEVAIQKNIKLRIKEETNESCIVLGDKERIRQVLNNLIGNSIIYGVNENGIIEIAFYDLESYILVEISDNGQGIEREHLPRLFERFYRVDKSRARNKGGSGLGLSIVKHIIEAHKQTINVKSAIGKGTTFSFTMDKG